MNNKFLAASLAAGVTLFLLGFVFYGVLLMDFLASQSITDGVWKETPDFVYLGLGELLTGAAITYVVGVLGGARDFMSGLKPGVIFGLLLALGLALSYHGTSNMLTLAGWSADVVTTVVRFGIAGGIAGLVMGKMGSSAD